MSSTSRWHGVALLAIVVIALLGPRLANRVSASTMYGTALVLLATFTLVAGHWVTGVWRGAFINDRNRISLSQVQLVLWTVLVLSGFLTIAFVNLSQHVSDALNIDVPESLWILMGISTTSLIGSPLLASRKKSEPSSPEEEATAINELGNQGRDPNAVATDGRLLANAKPTEARWREMFEAEELSRAGRLDLAKVQMFYFTLVVALAYGASLVAHLQTVTAAGIHAFPPLHESMIALLGISHAGYLTGKAVPERETR